MNRIVAIVAGLYGALYLLPAVLMNVLPYLPTPLGVGIYRLMPRPPSSFMQAAAQMSLGVVLLVFAWRRWHGSSRRTAQYTKQDEGSAARFEVIPASAPISLPLVLMALVFAVATVGSRLAGSAILGLIFVAFLAVLLLADNRGGSAAKVRRFRVGTDGIDTGEWQVRREDIHHLAIRNKFAGEVEVVYDADRGISTGRALGLGLRKKLADVAYRVEVESGGKAHVLAAGLDEVTARGLVAEVGRKMGVQGSQS